MQERAGAAGRAAPHDQTPLANGDLPISIGVILDASKSMESKIRTAQREVDRFVSMIHQDDEIFLMTFAMRASLIADFTC